MRDREDRRKFEGDVHYEVWRRGGNPDRINPDRLDDCYWEDHDPDECATRELERQRRKEVEE